MILRVNVWHGWTDESTSRIANFLEDRLTNLPLWCRFTALTLPLVTTIVEPIIPWSAAFETEDASNDATLSEQDLSTAPAVNRYGVTTRERLLQWRLSGGLDTNLKKAFDRSTLSNEVKYLIAFLEQDFQDPDYSTHLSRRATLVDGVGNHKALGHCIICHQKATWVGTDFEPALNNVCYQVFQHQMPSELAFIMAIADLVFELPDGGATFPLVYPELNGSVPSLQRSLREKSNLHVTMNTFRGFGATITPNEDGSALLLLASNPPVSGPVQLPTRSSVPKHSFTPWRVFCTSSVTHSVIPPRFRYGLYRARNSGALGTALVQGLLLC